jgi:hypothetical protein
MAPVVKIGLGVALCGALGLSVWGPPPRRVPSPTGLASLLGVALMLYGVGIAAAIVHRSPAAIGASALGVVAAALAGWRSRARRDDEEPPEGDTDGDGGSPAPGDHDGGLDWDRFDRERSEWQPQPRPASVSPKASSCNRGSPLSSG